ncbi:hypothetical protein KI126_000004 [Enterococcus faecium]|nr:hypothetical protein [Enterococcus faecium]
MKYIPSLKSTVTFVDEENCCKLKTSSNEGYELDLNQQGRLIIREVIKEKDINLIYSSIYKNSNSPSIDLIEDQVDKFLIDLSLRRVYLNEDPMGYLQKKRMSNNDYYIDPHGVHTWNLIKENSLIIKYNGFYFKDETVLSKRFTESIYNNQMFSVIDSQNGYVYIVKFIESFDLFEIIAILGAQNSEVMLHSYTEGFYEILRIFNFSLRNNKESTSIILCFKTSEKNLSLPINVKRNGVLMHEQQDRHCYIFTTDPS